MATVVSEKPIVPKLGRGDKDLKNRLKLKDPGKPRLFDTDRAFIEDVQSKVDLKGVIDHAKGQDEKGAEAVFTKFGQDAAALVTQLHNKYKDGTAEMVDIVAEQTGMPFPHKLQLLLEESLLCTRPTDKWGIAEGTHKAIKMQIYGCSILQGLKDAGKEFTELPCRCVELASFKKAAEAVKLDVTVEQTRTLPKDRVCEFVVRPSA